MTTLRAKDGTGYPYQVNSNDALWLSRAVQAEGPINERVAGALLNGFMFERARKGYSGTLADFVRSYSQPINQAWFPEGSKFKAAYAQATPAEKPGLLKRAEMRRDVHARRIDFTHPVTAAVRQALAGLSSAPAEATDFGGPNHDGSVNGLRAIEPITPGQNRLWAKNASTGWQGYTTEASERLVAVLPWLTGLTIVGLMGLAVWWAFADGGKA